jgi:hypothetical protein
MVGLKRLSGLLAVCGLLGIIASACVYDSSDRCGPNQRSISSDRCVCADGFVPGTNGCMPCGEHELAFNGACVCEDGYARASAAEACEPIPDELGAACDTESTPCAAEKYSLCHVNDGTSGYCTNTCSSASDCDGGYKCQEGGESFCRRPPLGFGDTCKSDDDCTGEATVCETIQSHLCLVPCAAGDTAGCFIGDVCCEFPGPFVACVPSDACTPENFGTMVE